MWRFLGEFISLIVFFLVVRSVIASVWQSVRGGIVDGISHPGPSRRRSPSDPAIQTSGELRKDPVCGTFVLMSTAFTAPTSDGTAFFCSKECRDAFQSGPRANKRWPDSTAVRN
ncbi:hypothetical protein [Nevskia soli]|jgi:YHS domain-containing protein|uniref:hypothetical protein n=1 Tax=Nevskia soli TaxID=418856 RepID=UPI0015D8D0E5|nr:hypothetical protein [Nevskia soli]